ncbi:alpha/beta fold hydrolase, partial [Shewanella sp. C31]|nr:alpha/beta fold hydrolase [Shewanella electrica]
MREEIGYIPVGEAELYVEDVGAERAPALFVLHGGPGGNAYALREGLQDYLEDFRVVYFDQRGSGRSLELPEDPRLFTVDALV